MSNIFIGSDNVVLLTKLYDIILASYVNAADSVIMSLFRETKKEVSSGAAVNEVQILKINAKATAGTWTLTYDGETTGAINYNASLATIKTALEALANVAVDDVVVSGNTLDTDPVGNGMYFTWADTLGDVNLMTFDVSSLTGPTQADTTLTEDIKGVLSGVAVNEGGGIVGIPVVEHGLAVGDRIKFANTRNYDNEYAITAITNDKVEFTETYVAETFTGVEVMYCGVPGGCNIALSYVSGSDGNYRGILPDDMEGIVERAWYFLFIESKKDSNVRLDCVKWQATYASLTVE